MTHFIRTQQHTLFFHLIMCKFLFLSRPAWWGRPRSDPQHPHGEDEAVGQAGQRCRHQGAGFRDQELQRSWAGRSGSGCPVDCYEPPHQGLGLCITVQKVSKPFNSQESIFCTKWQFTNIQSSAGHAKVAKLVYSIQLTSDYSKTRLRCLCAYMI